jgi:LacI family transcriptional regulator
MTKSTITEIAERVGVSVATVSRALNNQPGVGERRRAEIRAVAAALNYHPNAIARSLQGQRTGTVAYVADVSTRPAADLLFKDFITILAARCASYGMDLLIHPATDTNFNTAGLGRLLRSGRADGLILADTRRDDPRLRYLLEHRLRFIAFGRSEVEGDYPYVDIDGEWGIHLATAHVLARGHRRVAYLGMPLGYSYALHRRDGYLRALRQADLEADPALMAVITNESEARAAMERLLALPDPPTAFIAASDIIALNAMSAAMHRGLRAGRDYAMTGFDDIPFAAHTTPPLTTVRQPFDRACDELIALLRRVLDNEPGPQQVLLRPELIVRQTT